MRKVIFNLIFAISLVSGLFLSANEIFASDYGQEVKGVETEETVIIHKTVDTGIEDHFDIIGITFVAGSFVFYLLSKKAKVYNSN